MNIIEKADKYADGKANEAIKKLLPKLISMAIGMATMTERLKSRQISEIARQPTLISACRAEHFGQKTMRRMMVIFSTFHMKGLNT